MNDLKNSESNFRSEERNRIHSDRVERDVENLMGNETGHAERQNDKAERKIEKAEKKMDKAHEAERKAEEERSKGNFNSAERQEDKAERKTEKAEKKIDKAHEAAREADRSTYRTDEKKQNFFRENPLNNNDSDYRNEEDRKAREAGEWNK